MVAVSAPEVTGDGAGDVRRRRRFRELDGFGAVARYRVKGGAREVQRDEASSTAAVP
jgi:hypothetical protein